MLSTRDKFPILLSKLNLKIGVELGVATGHFSNILLNSATVEKLYLIDKWDDHHDLGEMFRVIKTLKGRHQIMRCLFNEALSFFEDASLDFIYIDGYAHTGQNGGETIRDWYPKLKTGGLYFGHDYHPNWQPTINSVNEFMSDKHQKLHLTRDDEFPSWYFCK
jgi:predicted O-methyltransferase YrrM